MRLTSLYKCVLVLVVRVDITVALFLNKCPDKLMWDLRAKNLCGLRDKYMCLYDTNAGSFRELCKDEPEFHRSGHIFIISGNLKYFAGRSCKIDKYQPYKWWTNGSSECQYLKSTCNEEGQVPYDDGTATNDRKCRCDYTNYYTFVSGVSNKCYCDHTVEDCSCNKKKCSNDQVLTPDYDCVGIHEWTGRFVCPEYKAPKITDEKKVSQTTTTICPFVKPDFPGTIQQSKARIAHTTMFIAIIVSGAIVLVMIRRSFKSFDKEEKFVKLIKKEAFGEREIIVNMVKDNNEAFSEREKIDKELKEEDMIRLLKHYQEIVENIEPSTIIPYLPHGIISDDNREKIERMYTKTQKARALIDIFLHSDQNAYLSFMVELRKNERLEKLADKIEKTKVTDKESIREFDSLLIDPVPRNLKNFHDIQLAEWIAGQNHIVNTRDGDKLIIDTKIDKYYSELLNNDRITIMGRQGCGKSSTLHCVQAAVIRLMRAYDYEIIPCTEPSDICICLRTYHKQIFVFVEVCKTPLDTVHFFKELNKKAAQIEMMIETLENKNRKKILIVFLCELST